MKKRLTEDFNSYLRSKGMILAIDEEIDKEQKNIIDFQEAEEKLIILADFHKRVKGYVGDIGSRLPNSIGQLMENYKAQLRRLKRDVNNIKAISSPNPFEKELIRVGEAFVGRGERNIAIALSADYIEKIYRSMKDYEICLGEVFMDNIYRKDGLIYIKDVSKCTYNLQECDVIDYINRLKRRRADLPYDKLIKVYIEESGLEESSFEFIRGMVNYPYEFIKVCTRYRMGKKSWTPEKYADSLVIAMIKDGEEI